MSIHSLRIVIFSRRTDSLRIDRGAAGGVLHLKGPERSHRETAQIGIRVEIWV